MNELLLATGNPGKLKELELLLQGLVISIKSLQQYPHIPKTIENGNTFEENAIKKAKEAAIAVSIPALADDSGLVVDALAGKPGVLSARFAGEGSSDADNNAKLLKVLEGVPLSQRRAAFHCVIALCFPDGTCRTFCGHLNGIILDKPRGIEGFGYDPLFLVPEYGKTLAELPVAVKNRISHRAQALFQFKEWLAQ